MTQEEQHSRQQVLHTARRALAAGISVLPIPANGSKYPGDYWKEFQQRRLEERELARWPKDAGICIICGQISGNLETLDFDDRETYQAFKDAAEMVGLGPIIERLEAGYLEYSPNGVHTLWHCEEISGNQKLARRPTPDGKSKFKVLIETRGKGGLIVVAPSSGGVHPSGLPYVLVKGSVETIATLTPQERQDVLDLTRCFDEVEKEEPAQAKPATEESAGLKPGEDFNRRADWANILEPHGWDAVHTYGGKTYWRRPGKSEGVSATTGHDNTDYLYVFSTSTEFEAERGYNKFSAYTLLNHQGDFKAAAKDLAAKGYGEREKRTNAHFEQQEPSGPKMDESKLLEFEATDEGNALAFLSVYGDQFLYCEALGWLYWNGVYWDMELAESRLDAKIVEVLKARRHAGVEAEKDDKFFRNVATNQGKIAAAIARLEPKLSVSVSVFDANPNLLNVKNGLLNLRARELTPHDPSQRFTYCLPVEYDPEADYSAWLEFLNDVVGDGQEVQDYIKMAAGYTLTGHTSEEILFYLYGPTRSGKGTFTETLRALLGRPLSAEVDFISFTGKRDADNQNFDLAPLKAARAVFASESERYQRLNPAKIKQLTGGNEVWCCFKHRDRFNYRPQFKMWMSSNWPVNGDADDDALWARVKVIHFPWSHLGKEDKELKFKMKSPENLRGVLRWAVEGASAWYTAPRGLEDPKPVVDWTRQQRDEADYVLQWLEQETEKDETAWTPNNLVMDSYQRWCKEEAVEPRSQKFLTQALKLKGYEPGQKHWYKGAMVRGVGMLKIKPVVRED